MASKIPLPRITGRSVANLSAEDVSFDKREIQDRQWRKTGLDSCRVAGSSLNCIFFSGDFEGILKPAAQIIRTGKEAEVRGVTAPIYIDRYQSQELSSYSGESISQPVPECGIILES